MTEGKAMKTYHFQGEEMVPSPALIYYRDGIEKNINHAIAMAGGADRLWPHVKSHKMAEVVKMQVEMGIKRFKCATIVEAEMAARAGGEHILLAYPLVGPNQGRFLDLVNRWPEKKFYAIGDEKGQIRELAVKAEQQGVTVNFCVDVNTGMNRTGVKVDCLCDFYKALKGIKGLRLTGFHCYDGNRHEKDLKERSERVMGTMEELRLEIGKMSGWNEKPLMIMGGSPTFPCYAEEMREAFVYYSPGTVFIYDAGYREQFPDLNFEPAAAIVVSVVSHPDRGYFTIDCGYKAISAEQIYQGVLIDVHHAFPLFQSEEHWTFQMEEGYEDKRPRVGQILYVLPWHICPTTALYESAVVVNHKRIEGMWSVCARNRLEEKHRDR